MSIKIGEHIMKVLSGDANVKRAVGERIYPVIYAKGEAQSATFPYIIYARDNSNHTYTMDAGDIQNANATIYIVAKTYGECLNLTENVCDALTETQTGEYGSYEVMGTELNVGGDNWDNDEGAYYIPVTASFTTQNKYKD